MTEKIDPNWQPTAIFLDAFAVAAEQHKDGVRKGSSIPYISHLLAVSALVIEYGGTEVQAGAALLHDVIEDTPTQESELTELMGAEVNAIVVSCSSKRFGDPKEDPWATKDRYLKNLESKSSEDLSLLVTLADKLHNAQSCVNEYPTDPVERAEYWQKFNAGYELQKHWYTSLYQGLNSKGTLPVPLMSRFKTAIDILFN